MRNHNKEIELLEIIYFSCSNSEVKYLIVSIRFAGLKSQPELYCPSSVNIELPLNSEPTCTRTDKLLPIYGNVS